MQPGQQTTDRDRVDPRVRGRHVDPVEDPDLSVRHVRDDPAVPRPPDARRADPGRDRALVEPHRRRESLIGHLVALGLDGPGAAGRVEPPDLAHAAVGDRLRRQRAVTQVEDLEHLGEAGVVEQGALLGSGGLRHDLGELAVPGIVAREVATR